MRGQGLGMDPGGLGGLLPGSALQGGSPARGWLRTLYNTELPAVTVPTIWKFRYWSI